MGVLPNATAWCNVGSRVASAFLDCCEEEGCMNSLASSFLYPGMTELSLSEQLAGLLREKTMPVTELCLHYCCRFGVSISDALKLAGFNGKVKDFIETQPCFYMHHG